MRIKNFSSERGLSLIEALIALLVLSIGLVGMGALMLTSLKNVHSSANYSVASAVVLDFEELLWLSVSRTAVSSLNSLDADGCISDDTIGTLATAVTNQWNTASAGGEGAWTDADRFKVPGISLVAGTTTVNGVDRDGDGTNEVNWKSIPVTLSWDEDRFSDDEDDAGEVYTATITLVCRPIFL